MKQKGGNNQQQTQFPQKKDIGNSHSPCLYKTYIPWIQDKGTVYHGKDNSYIITFKTNA
jgi:hypothetical protein